MTLSIITINLNNAEGLRKTIESVVCQTFNNFEFIVIDGASTDGSVETIKEFENRITYWVSEPDKGIYNAMNKGILKAKGEYLLMLNSGDVFYSEATLEKVFNSILDKDIVYGNVVWTKKNEIDFISNFPDRLKFSYFINSSLGHQAAFIKRDLHSKVGLYNEKYRIVSDWSFFLLALFKSNCSFKHIDIEVVKSERDGISCLPQNSELILSEKQHFLKSEFSLFLDEYIDYEQIKHKCDFYKKSYDNQFKRKIIRTLKQNTLVCKLISVLKR